MIIKQTQQKNALITLSEWQQSNIRFINNITYCKINNNKGCSTASGSQRDSNQWIILLQINDTHLCKDYKQIIQIKTDKHNFIMILPRFLLHTFNVTNLSL
jgi:hypothetical protein